MSDELRMRIGERLGLKPRLAENTRYDFFGNRGEYTGEWSARTRECIIAGTPVCDIDDDVVELPDWPNDIAAAVELLDEMDKAGIWRLSNGDGDSVDFDFIPYWGNGKAVNICEPTGTPKATVISMGWLAWKETQE